MAIYSRSPCPSFQSPKGINQKLPSVWMNCGRQSVCSLCSRLPEANGLPMVVYQMYSYILMPRLLEIYNEATLRQQLPFSMSACIVLFLKPDKPATEPNSYRPISLLQVDIKILAKVLSSESCINVIDREMVKHQGAMKRLRVFPQRVITVWGMGYH